MPETIFEAVLATQLRAYAEGGVRPVDRHAVADATIATGSKHPGVSLRVPRWPRTSAAPRLVLVLLLALLAVAAVVALGPGRRAVIPPLPVSPVPSATAVAATEQPSDRPSAGSLDGTADQSIFLRPAADSPGAMDVIAVRADGQERRIRRLEASLIQGGGAYQPFGAAARDGWLSVDVSRERGTLAGTWMLVDLRDPARSPMFVPFTPVIGGAWSGTGWFATVTPRTNSGFSIDVVDTTTGVTQTIGDQHLPGGGPDLIWAADGSGIVTVEADDSGQNAYGIRPREGGAVRPGLPALADRRGARWLTHGGSYIDRCQAPDCPIDRVNVWDAAGNNVSWYAGEMRPDRLMDASFSDDGSAIWLLIDHLADGRHVATVGHQAVPGEINGSIGTADLGPDVAYMWFDGLSADGGSQVAVGYWLGVLNGTVVEGPTAIIPRTANSRPSLHAGQFVGFVPGGLADTWPGEGSFQDVPDAPIPTSPPQPSSAP